jgi:L-ribulokinase
MSRRALGLGLDHGTSSCRALLVDLDTGAEVAEAVHAYEGGEAGVWHAPDDPDVARQDPRDHLRGLEVTTSTVLERARQELAGFDAADVVGIGVATTGSTPLPLARDGQPLAATTSDLAALAWLWKDHSAHEEAAAITLAAHEHRPSYVAACGGTYSAEWFWAKLWHCRRVAPDIFAQAHGWVELADWLPGVLVGSTATERIPRGACAAGHKAMYDDTWGGWPDEAFLRLLDPELAALPSRLGGPALPAGARAGGLCPTWARRLGLAEGTAVAVGGFDAHAGALAAGVADGVLVKVMGTSTCDVTVRRSGLEAPEVPGVCGVVRDSVLQGHFGIEAGQSAVGDAFAWVADRLVGTDTTLADLAEQAAGLAPGEHGLLALDWLNGNRTVLVDQRLTGLLVGLTLQTRPHHIYQALVEATAFGALRIVEQLERHGVPVRQVVACGGLPARNPALVQTYADVLGRPLLVSAARQTSALGAAMLGALAAGPDRGGYATAAQAQERLTRFQAERFDPRPDRHATYARMYELYRDLHDAFGLEKDERGLGGVMKELLALRDGTARR